MRPWRIRPVARMVPLLLLACNAAVASAQTIEVSPVGGYRFGGGFFERVTNQPVDMDGAPAVGAVVNIGMHDGFWIEGLFTHQEGRIDVPGGVHSAPVRWRVAVDQWLAGGLQEFGTSHTVRPFATGLLGFTRYAADGDSEIRLAVGAGGGVKLCPWRHVAVRLDGRVFTTFADVGGNLVGCGAGRLCVVGFYADLVWQAEFTAGLTIVF
jgi:hypothetical protein